jgi:hypothetical protein
MGLLEELKFHLGMTLCLAKRMKTKPEVKVFELQYQ